MTHAAGPRAYRRKVLGRTNAQEPVGLALMDPTTREPLGYGPSVRAVKRVSGGRTRTGGPGR